MFVLETGYYLEIMLKHIILTQGRSGSNFLVSTLNCHPAIVNYGEVLGPWTVASRIVRAIRLAGIPLKDRSFLEALLSSQILFYGAQFWSAFSHLYNKETIRFKRIRNVNSIGFKEFFIHFERLHLEEFLMENEDISIIYLQRNNLLRRCLSLQSLKQTGIISAQEKSLKLDKVNVDPEEILKQLDVLNQESEYERTLLDRLGRNPILRLSYEEAFSSPSSVQTMIDQVFDFLGVPPIHVKSNHKKILPKSLNEIVANYEELIEAIQNTQYAQYLDDD